MRFLKAWENKYKYPLYRVLYYLPHPINLISILRRNKK